MMSKRLVEPLPVYSVLLLLALAGLVVPGLRVVSAVAATIVGLILVSFFHELGHALMAISQGYRFLFLIIGPLLLEQTPAGPRVSLNRAWTYAGGVCACSPDGVPDERLRRAQMLHYLAGPATSLAIGAATFLIAGRNIALPAALMAAASLGMGVASLIPSRQGELISDGLGYLTLRRGGPNAENLLLRIRQAAAAYAAEQGAQPRGAS